VHKEENRKKPKTDNTPIKDKKLRVESNCDYCTEETYLWAENRHGHRRHCNKFNKWCSDTLNHDCKGVK
jgi:hypothetical protein